MPSVTGLQAGVVARNLSVPFSVFSPHWRTEEVPTSSRAQDADGASFHVPTPLGEPDYIDLDDVGNQTIVYGPPGNMHRLNLGSRWK